MEIDTDLLNKIYNQMVERSKNSNVEHIKYIKAKQEIEAVK